MQLLLIFPASVHTSPKEVKESRNVDNECADVQHCMHVRDLSNMKTLDTKEHHVGTEAAHSYNRTISDSNWVVC